jgi:hypothetical protein
MPEKIALVTGTSSGFVIEASIDWRKRISRLATMHDLAGGPSRTRRAVESRRSSIFAPSM